MPTWVGGPGGVPGGPKGVLEGSQGVLEGSQGIPGGVLGGSGGPRVGWGVMGGGFWGSCLRLGGPRGIQGVSCLVWGDPGSHLA